MELQQLETTLTAVCPGVELRREEPMSKHTSFRVGGPAEWMVFPKTVVEARQILQAMGPSARPFFLGNGSNLLVADRGLSGLVLKTSGLDRAERIGETALRAESGVLLSRLARLAADHGMTGLEFAAGIPGSLGGALVMNAGAYGGEMSQVVDEVTYLDEQGETHTRKGEQCEFSYRHSLFADHPQWLITGATLRLRPGETSAIRARMADLAAQRKEKQPLEYPSAGSTFKRPKSVDGTPLYAAVMIDQCGLRGATVGGAQVSEKHAGFLINRGGATCEELLCLMEQVKRCVWERFGVELEPEVKIVGD